MKRIIIFSILILANISFFGQNIKNWAQIKAEDFVNNSFLESANPAIVLKENTKFYFDESDGQFCQEKEVLKKIRINNKKGLKYGTVSIFIDRNENINNISRIRAYTFLYKNGEIKSYKLRHSLPRSVKVGKNKYRITFKMPKLEPGAIIVYKYTISSFDIIKPISIYVQQELPCLYSTTELDIPNFLDYQINIVGSKYLTHKEVSEHGVLYSYNFHLSPIRIYNLYEYERGQIVNTNFIFNVKKYVFTMENIPAFKNENLVDNKKNYLKRIDLHLLSFDFNNRVMTDIEEFGWEKYTNNIFLFADKYYPLMKKYGSQYSSLPIAFKVCYKNDWKRFDLFLYKSKMFGKALNKMWNYQEEYRNILTDKNLDSLQEMITFYDYIRDNYKWNGKYSLFASKKLSKISKIKRGNSADINLILISFLRRAGFKSFPVVIKTIDKGHINKNYASVIQFDHVIAAVKLNKRLYFLDAINPNNPWYILNSKDLNLEGRLINGDKSEFIPIIPNIKTSEKDSLDIKITDNNAICDLKSNFSGYMAFQKSNSYKKYFASFKSRLKNISDLKTSFKKRNDSTGNFSTEILFKTNEIIKGNTISPFKIFNISCPFMSPQRDEDIYFGYGFEKNYVITIHIPKDKKIISVPKVFSKQINGAKISARINISGKKIIMRVDISIEKPIFDVSEYNELREMFWSFCDFTSASIIVG